MLGGLELIRLGTKEKVFSLRPGPRVRGSDRARFGAAGREAVLEAMLGEREICQGRDGRGEVGAIEGGLVCDGKE